MVNPSGEKTILFERNFEDKYSDPGYTMTRQNGKLPFVRQREDGAVYLYGSGYSPKGIRPFLDVVKLPTPGEKIEKEPVPQRLWRCPAGPLGTIQTLFALTRNLHKRNIRINKLTKCIHLFDLYAVCCLDFVIR